MSPNPHAHRLLSTCGTPRLYRKSLKPILPVRSCVSSELSAFRRFVYSLRTFLSGVWAKIHILVCDVSNLAILDHQPSFRQLAPGVRLPLRGLLFLNALPALTDYACSRRLT